jgi:tetratricopeptide (TPR) repeat protein
MPAPEKPPAEPVMPVESVVKLEEEAALAADSEPILPPELAEARKTQHAVMMSALVLVLIAAGGLSAWYLHHLSEMDRLKKSGIGDGLQAGFGAVRPKRPPPASALDGGMAAGAKADGGLDGGESQAGDGDSDKKPTQPKKTEPNPRLAKALKHYQLGNTLYRKKKFRKAIRQFKLALKADSSVAHAHRGLGIAYAQLKNVRMACKEYRLYLKMLPADSKEIPALKQILKGCNKGKKKTGKKRKPRRKRRKK